MRTKKRIVLFGCKDTTLLLGRFLCRYDIEIHLVTISEGLAIKNRVAGYIDLSKFRDFYKTIYVASSYALTSDDDKLFFDSNTQAAVAFCVGWQRLIPAHVLNKFPLGVHGMHGSARDLPYGKGRSPMNWALIEGRKFFFTNLFKYTEGVDDGPVLAKSCFSINSSDTAETLHYKNVLSMCYIVRDNIENIIDNSALYITQNSRSGQSFYPKREPSDGIIDWKDDIYNVDRLVRAVAPPFYGALSSINGAEIRILRAGIFYTDIENHPFLHSRFGEILEIFPSNKFLVRCSGGVLLVHEYEGLDVCIGETFDQLGSPFSRFQRNVYGFFDI